MLYAKTKCNAPQWDNGKYSIFKDFYYAEFLAYYIFENKLNKTYEYHQLDELDDNLIDNNHEQCSCLFLFSKSKAALRNRLSEGKLLAID